MGALIPSNQSYGFAAFLWQHMAASGKWKQEKIDEEDSEIK